MIAKAWYVTCDLCGNPAQISVENGRAARRIAKDEGFDRRYVLGHMVDLCSHCGTRRDGKSPQAPRPDAPLKDAA